jgi:glucosamine 6-phosphate synthetase-like amidotransferase/phosphosugar isomerase protein
MVHDILDFGGEVLVVTNLNDLPREERLRVWLTIRCNEYFFPVPSLIPFQLLAHRIAETRGIEPGKLSKSRHVTTEE